MGQTGLSFRKSLFLHLQMERLRNIHNWFSKPYPANLMIQKPSLGSLLFAIITLLFVLIYKPVDVHESRLFGLTLTILIYCIVIGASFFLLLNLLRITPLFQSTRKWSILNEIIFIIAAGITAGIIIYFAGFIIENPENRWNISTFFNSLINGFLIGIIPVILLSILHIRNLFPEKQYQNENQKQIQKTDSETIIKIKSKARKDNLSFFANEFIFAESQGNYVVFHLWQEEQEKSIIIRNSITEINIQLQSVPSFIRVHRGFIINLKKVTSKKGNALGYQLNLDGCKETIPVSRQNIPQFDKLYEK